MFFFVCDVFLVTHVGELTHLRPLHTLMSQVEKHSFSGTLHALRPCSFARASNSKTIKTTPPVAHLSVSWSLMKTDGTMLRAIIALLCTSENLLFRWEIMS